MSRKQKADLSLVLVTIGWGASFILAKQALVELQVFNFLAIRFLLAFAISMLFFIKPMLRMNRETLTYGLGLGVVLFLAFSIQTLGLSYTSVSNSAFITGLSVVMVPLITAAMEKRRPEVKVLIGSITAVLGLGLLTLTGSAIHFNIGDVLTLVGALFFATHIIGVGMAPKKAEAIPMALLQIGTVGFLSLVTSFAVEAPKLSMSFDTGLAILLLALFCTAGAYIVQNVAQKYTTATRTALIYAMEPVFAAVSGFILLGEVLGPIGLAGAALILGGTLLCELPLLDKLYEKLGKKTGVENLEPQSETL